MMKLVFWNVFISLLMKICGGCLLNKQTNIYANQFLAANPNLKPRSRAVGWMDTNLTEMKALIGQLILQGIVQKPENGMYFSKRESTVTPYFSKIMIKKRFHLLKFLHFADNPNLTLISISRSSIKSNQSLIN